jgi:hypothetical protein
MAKNKPKAGVLKTKGKSAKKKMENLSRGKAKKAKSGY